MSYDLIVIGTSWGGLHATEVILGGLPSNFGTPIALVQHRSFNADGTMVKLLQNATKMRVREAEDKDLIERDTLHIAPPGYHLLIDDHAFALSTEGPVGHSRPSIDVFFESAADAYEDRLIGVLLTGANDDGASGLLRIRERGGLTVAEDPRSAEIPTMPAAAIAAGAAMKVLHLEGIAAFLGALDFGQSLGTEARRRGRTPARSKPRNRP